MLYVILNFGAGCKRTQPTEPKCHQNNNSDDDNKGIGSMTVALASQVSLLGSSLHTARASGCRFELVEPHGCACLP